MLLEVQNLHVFYGRIEAIRDTIAGAVGLEQAIPATAVNAAPSIRPSLNLLDDQSRYCGVPELSRCRTCLAQVALPLPGQQATRDIDGWRAAWATVQERIDTTTATGRLLRNIIATLAEWERELLEGEKAKAEAPAAEAATEAPEAK